MPTERFPSIYMFHPLDKVNSSCEGLRLLACEHSTDQVVRAGLCLIFEDTGIFIVLSIGMGLNVAMYSTLCVDILKHLWPPLLRVFQLAKHRQTKRIAFTSPQGRL
eukprot:Gb_41031 [translate_table: standard]